MVPPAPDGLREEVRRVGFDVAWEPQVTTTGCPTRRAPSVHGVEATSAFPDARCAWMDVAVRVRPDRPPSLRRDPPPLPWSKPA